MSDRHEQWLVERYWPGLTAVLAEATLDALHTACTQISATSTLDLVDGTWLPDDEILTARFAGTRAGVVAAHELAGASFDRLTRVIAIDRPAPPSNASAGG